MLVRTESPDGHLDFHTAPELDFPGGRSLIAAFMSTRPLLTLLDIPRRLTAIAFFEGKGGHNTYKVNLPVAKWWQKWNHLIHCYSLKITKQTPSQWDVSECLNKNHAILPAFWQDGWPHCWWTIGMLQRGCFVWFALVDKERHCRH